MRALAVSILLLSLAGCASAPEDPADATVAIRNATYEPMVLNVTIGAIVEWKNDDALRHTVTPSDPAQWGSAGSGSDEEHWMPQGATWRHTFLAAGTYDYFCIPHGGQNEDGTLRGQWGRVVVG